MAHVMVREEVVCLCLHVPSNASTPLSLLVPVLLCFFLSFIFFSFQNLKSVFVFLLSPIHFLPPLHPHLFFSSFFCPRAVSAVKKKKKVFLSNESCLCMFVDGTNTVMKQVSVLSLTISSC